MSSKRNTEAAVVSWGVWKALSFLGGSGCNPPLRTHKTTKDVKEERDESSPLPGANALGGDSSTETIAWLKRKEV